MRPTESAQSLDPASAYFFRLVPQMRFKCGPDIGSNVRAQPLKVFNRLRGQNNFERHFGYNIARLYVRQMIRLWMASTACLPIQLRMKPARCRRTARDRHTPRKRVIQYAWLFHFNAGAREYWITRFSGR